MSLLKRWWRQAICRHHWHWPEVDHTLLGEVVCCKCHRVDELPAHWDDDIAPKLSEQSCPFSPAAEA